MTQQIRKRIGALILDALIAVDKAIAAFDRAQILIGDYEKVCQDTKGYHGGKRRGRPKGSKNKPK